MAKSTNKSSDAAKPTSSATAAKPSPASVEAPATRTIFRSAATGRLVPADVAAADKKGHVAEALLPHYNATIVNASARASGVRVTLDVDINPTQLDFITSALAKARVSFSV